MQELNDDIRYRWDREIDKYLPQGRNLKILDAGTGSGFFATLLMLRGHEVTGIDLSEAMINNARSNATSMGLGGKFYVMDAERPDFPDGSFDVVITRNLIWTLPNPENAYSQWLRVLKKGGTLINFDADYGKEHTEKLSEEIEGFYSHDHVGKDMMRECDNIKSELAISMTDRPQWDEGCLTRLGAENIIIDTTVSKRIYLTMDKFYNPTPLFAISCKKPA
jgi:SAM-dependent methyltransferase